VFPATTGQVPNELGNIASDHRNLPDATGNFFAYQAYVAPSAPGGSNNNEAFVAVSRDGGHTWSDNPIPCSTASPTTDLNHQFPNVSVDPAGNVWYAWSDDRKHLHRRVDRPRQHLDVLAGGEREHRSGGLPVACRHVGRRRSRLLRRADRTERSQPAVVGVLRTEPDGHAGRLGHAAGRHDSTRGNRLRGGRGCGSGRQLFDDFGVDVDALGFAHIAYSHDSPDVGGTSTYTGYAVQTGGTTVGSTNN
jgi:hypothetical protein